MLVLSNSVDYQHTIWTLQAMDKETKQVTVNPFKRLTKNIIKVNRTPIVQAWSKVDDLNLMCILFLSSVTDYVPYGSWEEVKLMNLAPELVLTIVADVIAGIILYFVCKWLDGKK